MTVSSGTITIGITVTLRFHSFISYLARSRYLSFFFLFFQFYPAGSRNHKSTHWQDLIFLLTVTRTGRLAEIRWSVSISKSPRICFVSFPRTDSSLCIYNFLVWSNWHFLNKWITFPTQSYLVLYSICANFIDCFVSVTIWCTPTILLLLVYFCWWHYPYGVILWCYQKRIRFSLKVSLSWPCPSFLGQYFAVLSLGMPIQLFWFFHFCFCLFVF